MKMLHSSFFIGVLSLLLLINVSARADIMVPQGFVIETYASSLYRPSSLSFNSQGDLFVGVGGDDTGLQNIYKVASDRTVSYFGPGFYDPDGVAVDNNNNIYVSGGSSVNRILPNGTATTISNGPFVNLNGIAIDKSNQVFVADFGGGSIYKVAQDGQLSLLTSAISQPSDLVFSTQGDLYATDNGLRKVWKVYSNGTAEIYSDLYGPIAVDSIGHLYVAIDGEINRITAEGESSLFASGFDNIRYMTFDLSGNMFIADLNVGNIYKLSQPVPEPSSMLLFGTGIVGLCGYMRRKLKG